MERKGINKFGYKRDGSNKFLLEIDQPNCLSSYFAQMSTLGTPQNKSCRL